MEKAFKYRICPSKKQKQILYLNAFSIDCLLSDTIMSEILRSDNVFIH